MKYITNGDPHKRAAACAILFYLVLPCIVGTAIYASGVLGASSKVISTPKPDYIVKIDGVDCLGTGVYLGKGNILTCRHVTDGKHKGQLRVLCNGIWYLADHIKTDLNNDLSLLRVARLPIDSIVIGKGHSNGMTATAQGYFQGVSYLESDGVCRPKKSVTIGGRTNSNIYAVNTPAWSGMSGGAVVNLNDELIGILFATNGRDTFAVNNKAIKQFLEGI
jgi:S1-C subfamily serine protease